MGRTFGKLLKLLDGQPTGKRGQSMVEMALTAPILILMVLGLTEVGFLANNYLILQDAVRAGGRAAVNLDPISWKYGEARNQQRMDCDNSKDWHVLLLGTENTTGYGARTGSQPRGKNLADAGLGYYDPPADSDFGFFDSVACQVINAMQPLTFNDSDATGNLVSQDDVVVSAISYARLKYGGGSDSLNASPPGPKYATGPGTHGNTWVTVTGRWPLENRFCANSSGGAWVSGDSRDPFNYLTSDFGPWSSNSFNDQISPDNAVITGQQVHEGIQYHLDGSVDNPPKSIYVLDVAKSQPINTGGSSNNNQGVRGFVFSGHHKSTGGPGAEADDCYGSAFRVQDIEAKLNLDATFNPSVPNGGLVIVEIFWQHHPLFFGPLFQGFTGDRTRDPVLHVWGWFPVTAAEPTATPLP